MKYSPHWTFNWQEFAFLYFVTALLWVGFYFLAGAQLKSWISSQSWPGVTQIVLEVVVGCAILPRHLPKASAETEKDIHAQTQVALLKSPFVIASAIRQGDLRELPLLHNKENPVKWIASHLDVVAVEDVAKITMSAEEDDAGSLKVIVDAIADAYQREILGQQKR